MANLYNEAIEKVMLHLCWEDKSNSQFFLEEILFSIRINKSNVPALEKRTEILKSMLSMEDSLQEFRIDLVLGLQGNKHGEKDAKGVLNFTDTSIILLSKGLRNDNPIFTIEVLKTIFGMTNSAKMIFYLTMHKDKMVWVQEFLVNTQSTLPECYPIVKHGCKYEVEYYLQIIEDLIETVSQTFPGWKDWFRYRTENSQKPEDASKEEKPEENQQDRRDEGEPSASPPSSTKPSADDEFVNVDITGADDDFSNVAKAEKDEPESTQSRDQKVQEGREIDLLGLNQPDNANETGI